MSKEYIPAIKSFDCADHDPIETWIPRDTSNVDFWMNFSIGMPDKEGADNFQVHVITRDLIPAGNQEPRYAVVLETYSWSELLQQMRSILNSCAGENWELISDKLAKRFHWEFENYQPYKGD